MPLDLEKLAEVMVALMIELVDPARGSGDRLASGSEADVPGTRRVPDGPDRSRSRALSAGVGAGGGGPRPQGQAGRLARRQSLAAGCRNTLARDEGEGLSAAGFRTVRAGATR